MKPPPAQSLRDAWRKLLLYGSWTREIDEQYSTRK
jgi:hypothetical protein